MSIKIPEVTEDEPYIEFRFDKNGKMTLSKTSAWWGGKNSGFFSSDGSEGNTCKPKQLDDYIRAFKKRKIKELEKELSSLQKRIERYKKIYNEQ